VAHPQIAAFARLAKENAQPTRLVAGQKTVLARTMHDIRYDAVHDEFLVTNPFAMAILTFRGGAEGEEAPIRIIQGPNTQMVGGLSTGGADRLDVDPVHDEIFIPGGDRILVYPRTGNGDVAPIRILQGPDTLLRGVRTIAVDPVHDVVVVGTAGSSPPPPPAHLGSSAQNVIVGTKLDYQDEFGALLIYDRKGHGNVKPLGIIMGPQAGIRTTNQIRVYPPKGWIVATMPEDSYGAVESEGVFIGVWSIHDDGDVAPRWKLGGPKSTLKKPRGVALNPKTKEIYVADMRLNTVLTYYFPEIF